MFGGYKKNLDEREVKSTRSSSKPTITFDATGIGSNSVRDNNPQSTKNRPIQQNSPQELLKKPKSSKPSTPTKKSEGKEGLLEGYNASEKKTFIYFMTNMEKYHMEYNESDYFCQIYREHFMQTYQAMMFCRYLKPIDPKLLSLKKISLPRKEIHRGNLTLNQQRN